MGRVGFTMNSYYDIILLRLSGLRITTMDAEYPKYVNTTVNQNTAHVVHYGQAYTLGSCTMVTNECS